MGMDNPEPLLIPYYLSCIEKGYVYECSCGEVHATEEAGWSCGGCRESLGSEGYRLRRVVDLRNVTGEV